MPNYVYKRCPSCGNTARYFSDTHIVVCDRCGAKVVGEEEIQSERMDSDTQNYDELVRIVQRKNNVPAEPRKNGVLAKCPNCGSVAEIGDGKRMLFCAFCGARLTESENVVRDVLSHDHEIELSKLNHEQRMQEMELESNLKSREPNVDVFQRIKNSSKSFGASLFDALLKAISGTFKVALVIVAYVVGGLLGLYLLGKLVLGLLGI